MSTIIKYFGILFLIVSVSGCASQLDATYDQNEYGSLVRLEVISRMGMEFCHQPEKIKEQVTDLRRETEYLFIYTRHLPNNEDLHRIAVQLGTQAGMMEIRYAFNPPSVGYCKAKLLIFNKGVTRALKAAGNKRKQ